MKTQNRKIFAVVLIIVVALVAGFFTVKLAVKERLHELQLQTQVQIEGQRTLLTSIAEITARNGADELTERIIKDCSISERNRFDELLSGLDKGLTRAELVELERLFGRCGSFYSERKAIMVSRLSREHEILQILVNQLSELTGKDTSEEYKLALWKELVNLEQKQSELFSSLVSQQDKIITTLISGQIASSAEIATILQETKTIQQSLTVANSQAASVRSELVPL